MKKIVSILIALLLLSPQISRGQEILLSKEEQKECKAKLKEFKKQGWKVFGSSRTIDVLLGKHFEWLKSSDKVREIVGHASGFKSMNMGHQMAMNNAFVTYASETNGLIKGRVITDMKADASFDEAEFDKFYAVFERNAEKEIRGEIKESFSLIRENKKGGYEIQSFFLVNEEAASDARKNALKLAAEEAMSAKKYAVIVEKYINENKLTPKYVIDDPNIY